jgi:hypothetical protein
MNINNTIRRLASKQADRDSEALPKSHTRRVKSLNESLREYKPQGYYLYFCFHNKTLYEPCTACKRTTANAKHNLSNL